jgi:hypothetical protein
MRLSTHRLLVGLLLAVGLLAFAGHALAQIPTLITEIRTDNAGTDTDEYFELWGAPGTDLSNYTYIVIGDAGSGTSRCGVIESVTPLTGMSIQADGFCCVAKPYASGHALSGYDYESSTINFENADNVTHMLVQGFFGTNGQDLDLNDDGMLDAWMWNTAEDVVALINPLPIGCAGLAGTTERYYLALPDNGNALGPDITNAGTGNYTAVHVYRCAPDAPGVSWILDWKPDLFSNPLGSYDTPGAGSWYLPECGGGVPTSPTSWGLLKQMYN